MFEVKECKDTDVVKVLFQEYSQIKGAESCFVSFDKELNDLDTFYKGGALLVGYEEEKPVACIAIKADASASIPMRERRSAALFQRRFKSARNILITDPHLLSKRGNSSPDFHPVPAWTALHTSP